VLRDPLHEFEVDFIVVGSSKCGQDIMAQLKRDARVRRAMLSYEATNRI
jgi:hypothetical protein